MLRFGRSAGALCAVAILSTLFPVGESAGAPPALPKELAVPAGRLIPISIPTNGKDCKWVIAGAAVDGFREYDPSPDLIRLRLLRTSKGLAYLIVVNSTEKGITDPVVIPLKESDSPEPNPDPEPEPDPTPTDEFQRAMNAAYAQEASPQKAEQLAVLAEFYRQAGALADRADLTTWGALYGSMRAAATSLGLTGQLPAVQRVIQAKLQSELPSAAAQALDAAGRAKAKSVFGTVATYLARVK